nr:hypothetical protein [Tanacetum cinerariifolium]
DCRTTKNSGNRSRDAGNAGDRGRDNGKRPVREEDEKALVVQDRLGTYNWSYQVEEKATDFALMAFTSNPSSSLSLNFKLGIAKLEVVGEGVISQMRVSCSCKKVAGGGEKECRLLAGNMVREMYSARVLNVL